MKQLVGKAKPKTESDSPSFIAQEANILIPKAIFVSLFDKTEVERPAKD